MKRLALGFVLLSAVFTYGQDKFPRPYLAVGADLMPPGYSSVAVQGGGGLMFEKPYFILDSYVGYDNGHKVNDSTSNNNRGHDRLARGFASYKHGLYFAGVGARWSELSTSNYTKGGDIFSAGSWHPEIGGGRDFNTRDYPLFMRAQVSYMFAPSHEVVHYPDGTSCDGCGSGVHGADITLWFPSPAHSGHFFAKMNVVIFGFHDSLTDPTNAGLTRQQRGNTHIGDSTEFMAGFRF